MYSRRCVPVRLPHTCRSLGVRRSEYVRTVWESWASAVRSCSLDRTLLGAGRLLLLVLRSCCVLVRVVHVLLLCGSLCG